MIMSPAASWLVFGGLLIAVVLVTFGVLYFLDAFRGDR